MTRLAELIPDEASAYEFLERSRWKGTPMCPHCHGTEVTHLRPENGTDKRRTRTGAMSARRVWQCNGCREQFSVLTGTPTYRSMTCWRRCSGLTMRTPTTRMRPTRSRCRTRR